MHVFGALRTPEVHPSLLDLDFDVGLEAFETKEMDAISEHGKLKKIF
jgi:hypothetical protein